MIATPARAVPHQRVARATVAVVALAFLAIALVQSSGARAAAPTIRRGPAISPSQFPNDPAFAPCESQDPITGCGDNEQWNLFGPLMGNTCLAPGGTAADRPHPDGGLPCWAIDAHDPDHAAGVDITGAWAQGNFGRGDVRIAYIEGGVNYSSDGIKDALDNIYLNKGELPYPEGADGHDRGRYDFDGNGRFDIRDYAQDPRVNPPCPSGTAPFTRYEEGTTRSCVAGGEHQYLNEVDIGGAKTPYLSPEDLIAVFGHCRISRGKLRRCPAGGRFDNDGNGYPNDISGWNTQRNTNDPQTDDSAYNHAPNLISDLVGVANNGYAGVGVCERCRVIPIKQGAEAVGRSDQWAEALLYAVDAGARVVSSVVVSYTYSSFAREAVEYANRKGVLLSFDSNDFDSLDHTDGMLYDHAIPGNSLTQEPDGRATRWFRARSNVTSYGPHNVFSGEGNSTSGATPFMAGMLAMVQSAALNARDKRIIPRSLTPNEVRQVMMDTASPVIPQTQAPDIPDQWPGNPSSATNANHTNWSTQYGYGRPDIGAATALVMSGRVPPTAELDSPHWYAYVDPTRQRRLTVRGSVAPSAWRSRGLHWTLEWALGADPADADFHTIARGHRPRHGVLGTLDLRRIPRRFAAGSPTSTLPPDGPERYTVTLRLRARDGDGLKAEDRRAFSARHDPNLLPGYPRSIGTEMSAAPTYARLQGPRRPLDLVFGTYDGTVHALRPNGTEVPGFPVHTRTLAAIDPTNPENYPAASYRHDRKLRAARDPVSGIAVGDLDRHGGLDVVATTSNAFVYVWNRHGKSRKRFPVHSQSRFASLPVPTPRSDTPHSRLPSRGNWSPPVLANLEGTGRLDILMSAYDGFLYAWRPDGKPVPGWPVQVKLPASDLTGNPSDYIRDAKLISPPSVGDVLGTGKPQVFVPSFECLSTPAGKRSWMYGIWPDGNLHAGGPYLPGWPVGLSSLADCYDQSIDFVEEGAAPASIADFDGSGTLRVATAGITGPSVILNGNGSTFRSLSSACTSTACAPDPPYYPGDPLTVSVTGQGGIGDLLGDGRPEYVQSNTGALSFSAFNSDKGTAHLPHTYEQAWDATTGSALPTFPRAQDGFPFYDAPLVAGLSGSPQQAVVEANDSGWIHAYEPSGGEAPGFPKFTGQWPSFSGVIGAPAHGRQRLAFGTREGSLFVWRVGGSPKRDSWPHYHHDARNSGLFG